MSRLLSLAVLQMPEKSWLARTKSSNSPSLGYSNGELTEISPMDTKSFNSESSKPFAGPKLHRSFPCFAKASLNFLICSTTTYPPHKVRKFEKHITSQKQKFQGIVLLQSESYSCIGTAEATNSTLRTSIEPKEW